MIPLDVFPDIDFQQQTHYQIDNIDAVDYEHQRPDDVQYEPLDLVVVGISPENIILAKGFYL